MARRKRDAKGRFIKAGSARRRSRRRSVRVHTGSFGRKVRRVRVARHPVLVNPRRRHRRNPIHRSRKYAYVSNPRRHHRRYRKNPIMSMKSIFSQATLKNVGFAVVGLAGTPMLVGFIQKYLPSIFITNKWAGYALKAGSAWGLSIVGDKVAGKEAGRAILIGGLAYVAVNIIGDYFPTLLGAPAPVTTGTSRYLQAGKQPLLAEYMRGARGPITAGTPSRLDPGNRF